MIGLADCNNFFVSCERLFRPDLAQRPVAVLSSNDGCVVARSEEIKALGIPMGAPYFRCRSALASAKAQVFSSNFELYSDLSARVNACLRELVPGIEPYSIDETFLDLTGIGAEQLDGFLPRLCADVERWTGIPISIGAAQTKTLAKAANRHVKRNDRAHGVLAIASEEQRRRILAATPISDVWGIGRAWNPRLAAGGIADALQLSELDLREVRKRMGVTGEQLVRELRGQACHPMGAPDPVRKTLIHSRSFARRIRGCAELAGALRDYAAQAAARLRSHRLRTSTLRAFITTGSHAKPSHSASASIPLAHPTADTVELAEAAAAAARRMWKPGFGYRKAGLTLLDLSAADAAQGELGIVPDASQRSGALAAVDRINARYGRNTLHYCSAVAPGAWRPNSEMISPRSTTRISEIPQVS